jgi:hypothetical protein
MHEAVFLGSRGAVGAVGRDIGGGVGIGARWSDNVIAAVIGGHGLECAAAVDQSEAGVGRRDEI